jgi:hypothetical protein
MNRARFQTDPCDENTIQIRALFQGLSKHYRYAGVLLWYPDGWARPSLSGQTEINGGHVSAPGASIHYTKIPCGTGM